MAHAPEFDTKAFLAEFWPSAPQLHEWLANYGVADVTQQALYKQMIRDRIPSRQFALMLTFLELERGAPVSLKGFLK